MPIEKLLHPPTTSRSAVSRNSRSLMQDSGAASQSVLHRNLTTKYFFVVTNIFIVMSPFPGEPAHGRGARQAVVESQHPPHMQVQAEERAEQ